MTEVYVVTLRVEDDMGLGGEEIVQGLYATPEGAVDMVVNISNRDGWHDCVHPVDTTEKITALLSDLQHGKDLCIGLRGGGTGTYWFLEVFRKTISK